MTWPKGIHAITLFVEDLAGGPRVLPARLRPADPLRGPDSAVFNFGNTVINLLAVSQAPELIAPATVAGPEAGSRMQFSIEVDDVDAMVADLQSRGVQILNGPMNRPWGIRTAAFQDPAGHIWEIVGEIAD